MQMFNNKELNNFLKDKKSPNQSDSGVIISSNSNNNRRNSGCSSVYTDKDSNNDNSFGNIILNKTNLSYDDNTKCPHYLPSYIKWDGLSKDYMYRNDKSAGMDWIRTKSIRDAEHKSGYPKKQWVECPMYAKDPMKMGHKYIPRNDTVMMKRYISEFYPNSINIRENEDFNKIKRIWVYEDGFYSYQQEQRKKNLERNCTNGTRCPDLTNGKCPFNHYVENGFSQNLCPSDVGEKFSKCTKRNCSFDHSIDRVSKCSIVDFAVENNIIESNFNSLSTESMIKIVEFLNKGEINGMEIVADNTVSFESDNDSISIEIDDVSSDITDYSYSSNEIKDYVMEDNKIEDYSNEVELDPSFYKSQPYEINVDKNFYNTFRIGTCFA